MGEARSCFVLRVKFTLNTVGDLVLNLGTKKLRKLKISVQRYAKYKLHIRCTCISCDFFDSYRNMRRKVPFKAKSKSPRKYFVLHF